MIHADTIKLMRECDSGIKMGISAINDVLPHIKSRKLKASLTECKRQHEYLADELELILNKYRDKGKSPGLMAKAMSAIKTRIKMMLDNSDQTVANLMTDGCNMGIKSLNRYLNEYEAAEEKVKDITKKLIKLEDDLASELRNYL